MARYLACAAASTPYCYFQDDDWIVRPLRSMYANFLRFPELIHTDTNAFVYTLTNWQWCFFNDDVHLHACFSWVGTGAFASQDIVKKFLDQLGMIPDLDRLEYAYADMFFTTFANQVPYQLQNELVELPAEYAFSGGDGRIRNKVYMHKASKRLYNGLRNITSTGVNNGTAMPYFETNEIHPVRLRDVRSPCYHDRCLFLTNVHPFPNPRLFKYLPDVDITKSEIIHSTIHPSEHFCQHPFSHAVDNRHETSWQSEQMVNVGEYIGLDILLEIPVRIGISVVFTEMDPIFWGKDIVLEYSLDGHDYLPVSPSVIAKCAAVLTTKGKQELARVDTQADGTIVYETDPGLTASSSREDPLFRCTWEMPRSLNGKWRFIRWRALVGALTRWHVNEIEFKELDRRV